MNNLISLGQVDKPSIQEDPQREVLVRMYDCGFGDTFLMRIPTPKGKWLKVLFDCGTIKHGTLDFDDVVTQVIDDARDSDGGPPRIDVIVATHRHKDHILGFEKLVWSGVEVKEVWMPWTEDPTDKQAQDIQNKQSRLAQALLSAAPAFSFVNEIALNATTNGAAMQTLKTGFAGNPKRVYLSLGPNPSIPVTTNTLPGVLVYVLGPSRDPTVLFELDPPIGQSYLNMVSMVGNDVTNEMGFPFRSEWVVNPKPYANTYSDLASHITVHDRNLIQRACQDLENEAAAALDAALNGTSLMLLFQIGSASLLFPGDAQWGTWSVALNNPDSRRLLDSVNFYKVGHHASHNATPKEFVDKILQDNFWAMISTNHHGSYPQVPKEELINELLKKTQKVARTDKPLLTTNGWFTKIRNGVVEAHIPI